MKGGPELVIGIPKGEADDDDDAPMSDEMPDTKDIHLGDAFDALEAGDREGFIDSMRKCLMMADEGGYTGPGKKGMG